MLLLSSLIVDSLRAFYLLDTHKYFGNKGTGKKGRDFYSSDGELRIEYVVMNEIRKSRNKADETKHVWSEVFIIDSQNMSQVDMRWERGVQPERIKK